MTKAPTVSVVIVSRNRPDDLRRLLVSLRFLDYDDFEVILVSDIDPAVAFPQVWHVQNIRFVFCDEANISVARNLGMAHAAGDIVAFCDDDAVPEPSWLRHLCAVFSDPKIAAAGGYVIGRNGISFQWRGRFFDRLGQHYDLDLPDDTPRAFQGDDDIGIKTEGTNCAFRRDVVMALGGFDPAYHYYLDETDLNFRLGKAGWKTAIVPLAQVHHGYAANSLRDDNRVPKSLFEIGASTAYFLRQYNGLEVADKAENEFISGQYNRLIEFLLKGALPPDGITPLMDSLRSGLKAGAARRHQVAPLVSTQRQFQSFRNGAALSGPIHVAGPWWAGDKMHRFAAKTAQKGRSVTVFRLSRTALFHRHRFLVEGYWLQTGGIFGRSDRAGPVVRLTTSRRRVTQEAARLARVRSMGKLIFWRAIDDSI